VGTQVRTALVALDMAGVGLVAGGAYGSRATCSGPAPGCDIKYSYLAASGRDLDAAPLEKKKMGPAAAAASSAPASPDGTWGMRDLGPPQNVSSPSIRLQPAWPISLFFFLGPSLYHLPPTQHTSPFPGAYREPLSPLVSRQTSGSPLHAFPVSRSRSHL